MSEIKAILLVPETGDPLGLLKDGPCGARPPMARRWTDTANTYWDSCGAPAGVPQSPLYRMYDSGEALVLAWDGKPVPEGMDRAARRWEAATESGDRGLSEYDLWWCRLGDAIDLGHECQRSSVGTLVLLDADGKEIK